ncbi:MAG: efflux RND transporter periplasmic adaptor subunit, partial [Candidatus Binataceae bacterium]
MSWRPRIGFGLAAAMLMIGCARKPDPKQAQLPPPTVITVRPQLGTAIRSITLPGDLIGYYESTLYAKVTGYLRSIYVDKGDRVKKGQVLAVIEVPELKQRLERAKANLAIQRITYQRLHKVWSTDPRLVALENVDIARSKYRQAKAEADELAAMDSYTQIIAPFDGVITGRFVDPGALIKAGAVGGMSGGGVQFANGAQEGSAHPNGSAAPVLSEAMIKTLRTYVYVPQDVVPYIRRGEPARLTLKDFPRRVFHGKVTRFANSLDLGTRTMLTEVDIKNPRDELYPGMYAEVTLQLQRHAGVLMLPNQALEMSATGSYVYVVKNGRLLRQPVVTGINNGRRIEIVSGLTGKDSVVK